jgi:indole-3-glycerol phosphate synthase
MKLAESSFLAKIDLLTRRRVEELKVLKPEGKLLNDVRDARAPFDFLDRLQKHEGIRVIAEIKRQSPSQGEIAPNLDPVEVARGYLDAGAAAISVLTEPTHFGGSIDVLVKVRKAHPRAALLMKDFVIDPYQLLQARVFGADAVLLIHALLGSEKIRKFYRQAVDLGLTPLVEVHDLTEFQDAMSFGAQLIGVNNRCLKTLKTDLTTSLELAPYRNEGVTLISESGIRSLDEIQRLEQAGYEAFLIGTSLMQGQNPGAALRALLKTEASA